MKLHDFNYILPPELIAHYPLKERTKSRLLCLNGETGEMEHRVFKDLLEKVSSNDLLIFNDSRVIPARLFARKQTGGRAEILIERIVGRHAALAHVRANRSLKNESHLFLENGTEVTVRKSDNQLFKLEFLSDRTVLDIAEEEGHIPLPPYIDRSDEELDQARYQTVYARLKGSVAAPTAGLHFDEGMIKAFQARGVEIGFVTLHVGAGTFQPVRVQEIEHHVMHSEYMKIGQSVCDQVRRTRERGGRVIAVGTTAVRSLETASQSGQLAPYSGETDIFITPGYRFRSVDAMVTNFHLSESTLLMLVSAFIGRETILEAYQEAIYKQYRFYSYGDAMFITRGELGQNEV